MSLHTSTAPLQYGAVIGEGGMGVILEARQAHLKRTIAVKRLHRERSNSRSVRALLAEARITGAVAHPCVVPVHDLGIGDDGQPEIRLKRIEGRPWTHLLRNPGLLLQLHNPDDILAFHVQVLIRVCEAVQAAHSRLIIHRDLKPGNVMIGKLGEVYLLDWGLAATLDPSADPRLPRPSANGGGTPQYMAPEMVSNSFGDLGPCSDVYLLGGLLFYILNGRAPHPGATSWNMLVEACEKQVPVPNNGPQELVELCKRALRRVPTERLRSADALRNGLQTWLDHRASATLAEEGLYNADLLVDDIQ
ncbi:MAG: serine/threonine-protein kinase, partial [Myxococcota bacterium]